MGTSVRRLGQPRKRFPKPHSYRSPCPPIRPACLMGGPGGNPAMPENNVECPQCGRLFRVPGELLGHRFRCLKCYTVFETSAPAASAAAFQAASAATAL